MLIHKGVIQLTETVQFQKKVTWSLEWKIIWEWKQVCHMPPCLALNQHIYLFPLNTILNWLQKTQTSALSTLLEGSLMACLAILSKEAMLAMG